MPDHHMCKDELWSNRDKKKELLLDDVGTSSRAAADFGSVDVGGTKRKRGRPSISNVRGEQKSKAKPRKKTAQLSTSVNGPDTMTNTSRRSAGTSDSGPRGSALDDPNGPIDLSSLPLPGIDEIRGGELYLHSGEFLDWLATLPDDVAQLEAFMGLSDPIDDLLTPDLAREEDDRINDDSTNLKMPDHHMCKDELRSNRDKRKELLLDGVGTSSIDAPDFGSVDVGGTKRKRRDREHSREMGKRSNVPKAGRPSISNVRGEQKSKAKPRRKTSQLSTSVNGLLGRNVDGPDTTANTSRHSAGTSDSGARGSDLDEAFMGLSVPMDDLSTP